MSWRDRAVKVEQKSSWRERSTPVVQEDAGPSLLKKAEAGVQGLGQGGLMGYLPNIQAASEQVTFPIMSALSGQNVEADPYVKARDAYKQRDVALQKEAPGSYLAGELAGAVATPVPGMGLLKSSKVGAKIGQAGLAAAQGAIGSALYNPGDVEGQVSGLQLGERLKQGAAGGLLGGGMTKVGQSISKLAERSGKAANFLTTKAIGAQKGDFKKILKKNELDEVAEFARKSGIVKAGNNIDEVVTRTDEILKDTGPKIKQIYAQTQAKVNDPAFLKTLKEDQVKKLFESELVPEAIVKEINEKLSSQWTKKAGGQQVLSRIQPELEQLKNLGPVTDVEDLLKFRQSVDDLINFDKPLRDMAGGQEALVTMRRAIQDKIDNRIGVLDDIVGGSSLKELKTLNRAYKNASTIKSISQSAQAGAEANLMFGLTDRQMFGSGLGLGALASMADGNLDEGDVYKPLMFAAATGAGSKLSKRYGAGVGAGLLSKARKPLEKAGGLLQSPITQRAVDRLRRDNE